MQVARQSMSLIFSCSLQVMGKFGQLRGALHHFNFQPLALVLGKDLHGLLLTRQRKVLTQIHNHCQQTYGTEQRNAGTA